MPARPAIYAEHAALSAFENEGRRDFDIGAHAGLTQASYDGLPAGAVACSGRAPAGDDAPFRAGRFLHRRSPRADGTARCPALASATSEALPLLLNTGRLRDHWHTMTRTGLSPRLSAHSAEPSVQIHPEDARRYGLTEGGFARIANDHGSVVLKVALDPGMTRGSLFARSTGRRRPPRMPASARPSRRCAIPGRASLR